MDKFC